MRRPLAEIRHQALLAVRLRAKLENLLLPQEFDGERGGNEIGKQFGRRAFEILGIIVVDQRVAGFVQFHEFALNARICGSFAVLKIICLAFEERILCGQLEHAKGSAANGKDIHPAVAVALHHIKYFGSATDARDTVGKREKHAERGFLLETGFYHLAVTRLENVQRQVGAGEKDDVQRKKRNAFRPHGSQNKSYQREREMYGK